MSHTHTHTHTPNFNHWQYQLNQIAILLQMAITKCSLDNESDVLVRISFDKTVRILNQVGDVINAEKVMENNSEPSEL